MSVHLWRSGRPRLFSVLSLVCTVGRIEPWQWNTCTSICRLTEPSILHARWVSLETVSSSLKKIHVFRLCFIWRGPCIQTSVSDPRWFQGGSECGSSLSPQCVSRSGPREPNQSGSRSGSWSDFDVTKIWIFILKLFLYRYYPVCHKNIPTYLRRYKSHF